MELTQRFQNCREKDDVDTLIKLGTRIAPNSLAGLPYDKDVIILVKARGKSLSYIGQISVVLFSASDFLVKDVYVPHLKDVPRLKESLWEYDPEKVDYIGSLVVPKLELLGGITSEGPILVGPFQFWTFVKGGTILFAFHLPTAQTYKVQDLTFTPCDDMVLETYRFFGMYDKLSPAASTGVPEGLKEIQRVEPGNFFADETYLYWEYRELRVLWKGEPKFSNLISCTRIRDGLVIGGYTPWKLY